MLSTSADSATSGSSVVVNDLEFCTHGKEVCKECAVDHREDNLFSLGIDPFDREPISIEYSINKDGEPECRSHRSVGCSKCWGFKKSLVKQQKEAKKAGKKVKVKNPTDM